MTGLTIKLTPALLDSYSAFDGSLTVGMATEVRLTGGFRKLGTIAKVNKKSVVVSLDEGGSMRLPRVMEQGWSSFCGAFPV
jgi:hypothetical protein